MQTNVVTFNSTFVPFVVNNDENARVIGCGLYSIIFCSVVPPLGDGGGGSGCDSGCSFTAIGCCSAGCASSGRVGNEPSSSSCI